MSLKKFASQLPASLLKHQAFLWFLIVGLSVRLINLTNRLYFTWDQGRDAWILHNILRGDITLIGPTSGLQGFFLGPLWYYAGVPGMLLSGGNPYGISVWYVLLACLALPLFWLLGKALFPKAPDTKWAIITAYALALVPGSIKGSTFIWNPLLSMPLVSLGILSLFRARQSRLFLGFSFLVWGLLLQSEFAYGIFFIVPLWLVIGWIRQRIDWRDYLWGAIGVGSTLLPQLIFEIRHQFIMTHSLWSALTNSTNSASWIHLLTHRPQELWWATQELFFADIPQGKFFMILLVGVIIFGLFQMKQLKSGTNTFRWQLMAGLTILPYIFYMMWRGNNGNFFDYYITPHFIFLVPVLIFGIKQLGESKWSQTWSWFRTDIICLSFLAFSSLNYALGQLTLTHNEGGLKNMVTAIDQVYTWQQQDLHQDKSALRIYTPNSQTEHYDYLSAWYAQQHHLPVMNTLKNEDQTIWYVILEPDNFVPEERLIPWYEQMRQGGVRIRSRKQGSLILETFANRDVGAEMGLLEIPPVQDLVSTTVEVEFMPDHNESD